MFCIAFATSSKRVIMVNFHLSTRIFRRFSFMGIPEIQQSLLTLFVRHTKVLVYNNKHKNLILQYHLNTIFTKTKMRCLFDASLPAPEQVLKRKKLIDVSNFKISMNLKEPGCIFPKTLRAPG